MSARPLFGLLDVGVDQQAVHLRVDVLHGDLEAVETPGLRHLHFLREALHLVATTTTT